MCNLDITITPKNVCSLLAAAVKMLEVTLNINTVTQPTNWLFLPLQIHACRDFG
jgi:hypothetical protein